MEKQSIAKSCYEAMLKHACRLNNILNESVIATDRQITSEILKYSMDIYLN